jgi:SAM-dependent methyltransferase
VREQSRLQAATFTDEGFATRGLDWIVAGLRPAAAEQVLDVAAGAGHLGRALAPHVAHVSAVDLTPEMLEQGQHLASRQGLRNIDIIAAEDPLVASETNRLERLRDPSHGRTLTVAELHGLLSAAGAVVGCTVRNENDLDFEDWMARTQTLSGLREQLRERIGHELGRGEPTGLRPRRDEHGTVTITHTWAMITATPAPVG